MVIAADVTTCAMLYAMLNDCLLCCGSQFRLADNANDDLELVFSDRLRAAGRMVALPLPESSEWLKNCPQQVAMLDTWEEPVYNTRCWCGQ